MAWTIPRTWVHNEVVTAAMVNAHVRDNELVIKTTRAASGQISAISSATFASLLGDNLTGIARLGDTPAPSAWYRAHTIAQADGSAVSLWKDDSGNVRDLSQATVGLQPVYRTNAELAGFPAVYFDGTGRRFPAAAVNVLLSAAAVGTIFVVFRLDTDAAGVDVLMYTGNRGIYFENAASVLWAIAFDGTSDGANVASTRAAWHVGTWMYDGQDVYVGNDDADLAAMPNNPSGAQQSLTALFQVGSDGVNHLKGYVAEIIVFPAALTEEQRRRVHRALTLKYGITDGTTAAAWSGNAYTDGRHRYTGTSRFVVPVGRDKWENVGVGLRRGVWVEGDHIHHIDQNQTTEWQYLGDVVSTPPGALAGSLWVEGDFLHYVSATGVERRCQSLNAAGAHADTAALGGSAWAETYVHWVREGGTDEKPGHADVAHSDGTVHNDTHSDVAHQDSHTDTGHADSHGDGAHTDVTQHSDVHEDVCLDPPECFMHTDTHGDHSDHADTAHSDSHTDTAHDDVHSDSSHNDTHSDHGDHGDGAHADQPVVVP